MNRLIRPFLATACLPFAGSASADFAGMYIDTSDPVVLDGVSYKSHRVYALFTDPADRTFSVAGLVGTGGGPALEFQADSGQLFLDCGALGCDFFDCDTQSQPVASLHGAYHSFVCIRSGNIPSDFPPFGVKVERDSPLNPGGVYPEFPNNISFSPDVLCSALPNEIRIQGNSWSTGGIDGGYIPADPLNGKSTGQIILIAQFTLPESSEFTFQGNLLYNYTPEGFPKGTQFPGQTEFFVSSSDFSGLSECTEFESFFTAFSEAVNEDPSQEWDLCEDGIFDLCQGLVTQIGSDPFEPPSCDFNTVNDLCEYDPANLDRNDNLVKDTCECIADLTGDNVVDLVDFVTLLFNWKREVSEEEDIVSDPNSSRRTINQLDLDVLLTAAVPPDTPIFPTDPNYPLLVGCQLISEENPLEPSPIAETLGDKPVSPDATETREGISDGLSSPSYSMPQLELQQPLPLPPVQKSVDRSASPSTDAAEVESGVQLVTALAVPNADPIEQLLGLVESWSGAKASSNPDLSRLWDIDQNGMIDPWVILAFPPSEWPSELKPFSIFSSP